MRRRNEQRCASGFAIKSAKELEDGTWGLELTGAAISDFKMLSGAPISILKAGNTAVADLAPLRGMGLITLALHHCPQLTDLTPLAETKTLTSLTLPPNAKDIEFLRAFPKLERLGTNDAKTGGGLPGQPVAEFWKEREAKKK